MGVTRDVVDHGRLTYIARQRVEAARARWVRLVKRCTGVTWWQSNIPCSKRVEAARALCTSCWARRGGRVTTHTARQRVETRVSLKVHGRDMVESHTLVN
jgi:hypothetical protein